MTFTPPLSSSFNDTKNRSRKLSPQSGMCSLCDADCVGTCEIGLSAVLGAQTVYPTTTGENQVASEKDYGVDYSHFNINGRVFGAAGADAHPDKAAIFNVNLEGRIGLRNPVKTALPLLLPALIKLNWQDYFAGAAMAGVCCVIGEGSPSKDSALEISGGKIKKFAHLDSILASFRKYYRGYGQIILQCNIEDDAQGLPEYAITQANVEAIEFKFGQSAKGTQPVVKLPGYEAALQKQATGALVYPDPSSTAMREAHEQGTCPNFYVYHRLPLWDEEYLNSRISRLREMGLKNVYFKMAGYDPVDLERVLRLASALEVDAVTFDGAGGGSGYSPCKMMNEWSLPTVCLEEAICKIADRMRRQGLNIPSIVLTGGFATEDQVYKALAYGAPYISHIGICRAAMAAANSAKRIGELVRTGHAPQHLKKYGSTVEELFADLPDLRHLYGREADGFSPGAIGVFSYLNRIAMGLRHFAALNRKFDLSYLDRSDLIPLTPDARALLRNEWSM
jgi:hypothetical protein